MEIVRVGFCPDPVDYLSAWDLQRTVHADVVAGQRPDTTLLLEHPPTYTAGKLTSHEERPTDGTPVVDVDRGGKITWHGPGQLVGYPIVRLLAVPVDVVAHVRRMEAVLIAACADLGLAAERVSGRSGVWVPGDGNDVPPLLRRPARKVAAIGVRVSRRVTMHGFALNVDCDLRAFSAIVPCGITDAGVTSLSAELGRHVSVAEAVDAVEPHLTALSPTDMNTDVGEEQLDVGSGAADKHRHRLAGVAGARG